MKEKINVAAVLFEGFELLDFYGPLEMFGLADEFFVVYQVAEKIGPVRSSAGVCGYAEYDWADERRYDLILVPGGAGTRRQAANPVLLEWLRRQAQSARILASVCTGAGVLAAAGLLDGYRATTNKQSFAWPMSQGPETEWVKQARWVEDRNRFTSAGISAGMDMALRLIEVLVDAETAERVANEAEYEWNRNPSHDPFAARFGLI
ncbi:DJ-1/PfpI family protein [Hahella sp. KA22]|uniref:DJ-1/PfpI family protein n=1 Tax=Hahella sp. KA22 TaxID=1628392 RepID=UPI000FDF1EC8|nr:DJ-1/PfpI family protein [Hahella sp. KA22]AZZ91937.1 DJ-1/PfpI family protein [Hahella sp. KA22]QAY55308.1 DJ-1/PfpI family protein [Hahella sp. KA22]